MRNRFFTLGLFLLISLNLNAQPGIILDSVPPASAGQTVCIPIKTKGFLCVVTMQGSISWDPQVLNYDKIQNILLASMTSANFLYPSQGNHLLFSWADANAIGVTKEDGQILFEICFIVVGPAGSSTNIKIDTAEILSCSTDENLWTYAGDPYMNYYFTVTTDVSELTTSKQPAITINPNPTSINAQVVFNSQKDGAITFLVTNALGQAIFEQKINITIGENQIQIPAEALTTTGVYQVTLQTEQGAASQVLIVR